MSLHPTTRTALGLLLCAFLMHGQLPDDAKKAADRWLATDCSQDDEQRLEDALRKYKAQIEPVFVDALRNGPDASRGDAVRLAAAHRFESIQQLLKSKNSHVTEADRKVWEAMSRDEYINRQVEDFRLRYRSRAAAGLGVVDGEAGRSELRKIAQDGASPLQSSAQAALLRLGDSSVKRAYQSK
ncbi:MAG TPA: hypothetical protein VKE70_31525 [Candidatus Solibacter sp.]|nr:hypothetical protein [Candidatus Solibacter sp.]